MGGQLRERLVQRADVVQEKAYVVSAEIQRPKKEIGVLRKSVEGTKRDDEQHDK